MSDIQVPRTDDVKTVVADVVDAVFTTQTVKFTCCLIPWTLQISHSPIPSSQPKPAASS